MRVIKNKNIKFEEFNNYLPILNASVKKDGLFRLVSNDDLKYPVNAPVYSNYLDLTADCNNINDLISATSAFLKKYFGDSELGLFIYSEDKRNYCELTELSDELKLFTANIQRDALVDWLIETGKPKVLPDPNSSKINGSASNYLIYHSREDIKKKLVVIRLSSGVSDIKIQNNIDTFETIFRLLFLKSEKMIMEKELKLLYNDLHVYQSKLSNDFKLSAIGELTSGIAEEILSPLQIILSNAGFLNVDDSNQSVVVNNIKTQVKKVEALVSRVLKFANVEDTCFKLNAVNINEILESYHSMVSSSLESEKYECILNLDKNIPTILSNAVYLNQLLSNIFFLIRNNDKNKGGGILIQTKYADEKVHLRIVLTKKLKNPESDGIMNQEFKLIKNLMNRHEGSIFFENKKNSGSLIVFSFPLKRRVRK